MSVEPVDVLVDQAPGPLGDLIQAHLDTHPLPADDADVDAIVRRLEARLPRRPVPWLRWGVVAAAAAAVVAMGLQAVRSVPVPVAPRPSPSEALAVPVAPAQGVAPTPVEPLQSGGNVELVVELAIDRPIALGGAVARAGEWIVVLPDGTATVFADGTEPPADLPAEPLRRARWDTLDSRTLDRLDAILEP